MPPKLHSDRLNGHGGLVSASNPRSAAAEAYRTLRTNLQFSALDRDLRCILVTSPTAGDGKTTVAANLGVALAESGKRVLLIDCDLRRPGLHAVFGLPRSPGLTEALVSGQEQVPSLPTAVPDLQLLPAGESPPNPAEFIASARLAGLLARARETADYILLDSPPVTAVADPAVLATLSDGVILVVSAGRTRRELAQRAKEQLDRVGAHLLGAVLNNARLGRSTREYHQEEP